MDVPANSGSTLSVKTRRERFVWSGTADRENNVLVPGLQVSFRRHIRGSSRFSRTIPQNSANPAGKMLFQCPVAEYLTQCPDPCLFIKHCSQNDPEATQKSHMRDTLINIIVRADNPLSRTQTHNSRSVRRLRLRKSFVSLCPDRVTFRIW